MFRFYIIKVIEEYKVSVSSVAGKDFSLWHLLFSKQQVKLSLTISLVVGSILNIINQGHLLVTPEKIDIFKLLLTYCVPYGVSTYSAVMSTLKQRKNISQICAEHSTNTSDLANQIEEKVTLLKTKIANDASFLPKNFANFMGQFENIYKLNPSFVNDSLQRDFDEIKEVINTGDLSSALALIEGVLDSFTHKHNHTASESQEQLSLLQQQREQLLQALKKLAQ